jgi:hypothetical protein
MSRMIRALLLLAAFGLWSAILTAQPLKLQTSNQSAVTVKATPKNVQGDVWEFEIVFDTHSQDLKDDLLKSAVLLTADGKQVAPTAWNGDPPSGHHRKGVLQFNAIKPQPDLLELRITRPGEPAPRIFKWNIK